MSDLEQRVKALESKVKLLEETLETLKNMSLSEQMGSFIQSRQKSLKMVDLLNTVSDDEKLNFDKERETLNNVRTVKTTVDAQISQALRNTGIFSEDFPDDPRYFNYEVETGLTTNTWLERQVKNSALERFAGKGIRITAYNGFETNRVIIPSEIDGLPVISIGEKAFINANISEVILPKSIKAILDNAFDGCKNLKSIDLPQTLAYMGSFCFANSGLTQLAFPDSLRVIPRFCCNECKELETISIGHQVEKIDYSAFGGCSKIQSVTLPESLIEIDSKAFSDTSITTIIFPSKMTKVSKDVFCDGYSSYSRNPRKVTCVFLGEDTSLDNIFSGRLGMLDGFLGVSLIYCLPGSKIQQIARERKIPMKPLSEFRMEDYQ